MHDHVGFEFSCDHAQIGWVAVRFVREWVHTMPHASPFPRRQELPRGSYHVGAPPRGVRCYVLSHAWASSNHPSPSGSKYRLVTQALDADGAADEDVIFLECVCMHMHACMHANPDPDPVNPDPDPDPDPDPNSYASLFQPGRLKRSEPPLAWAPQREWTEAERQLFIHATSEISGLYSFKGCRVIVLPQLERVPPVPLYPPAPAMLTDSGQPLGRREGTGVQEAGGVHVASSTHQLTIVEDVVDDVDQANEQATPSQSPSREGSNEGSKEGSKEGSGPAADEPTAGVQQTRHGQGHGADTSQDTSDVWGVINRRPYECRGWVRACPCALHVHTHTYIAHTRARTYTYSSYTDTHMHSGCRGRGGGGGP